MEQRTKKVECRIVNYCNLEEKTEFRSATNLPETGELSASNEEIGEFYRNRWQIELLWKFLKRCAHAFVPRRKKRNKTDAPKVGSINN